VGEHDDKPIVERAIELMVYAPIGLAMFARDVGPTLLGQFVERGKARVDELQKQVENQVLQARIMGQFAVAEGERRIKREVEQRFGREDPVPAPRVEAHPAAPTRASGNGSRPKADASGLPIQDYDELSASQVVARLAGLSGEELDAVRVYEESQRQRRTILTRIEQLTA